MRSDVAQYESAVKFADSGARILSLSKLRDPLEFGQQLRFFADVFVSGTKRTSGMTRSQRTASNVANSLVCSPVVILVISGMCRVCVYAHESVCVSVW